MAIHFSAAEMAARKSRLLAAMAAERLDGAAAVRAGERLLAHRLRQFRLLLLPVPLCRRRRPRRAADPLGRSAAGAAHLQHRRHPHLAATAPGADPTRDLRAMLDDLGAGRRLGVEFDSYGLTHFNGRRLEAALAGRATLVDASRARPAPARDQIGRGTRLCPRGRAALRSRRPRGDRGDARRRRRGRNPRRDASRDLRRRRRLSRQRIHHRLGRRRAALPLQERAASARRRRPAHARIRRRLPALSRRDHAHACRRARDARCIAPTMPPRARRSTPARRSCSPDGRRATCSPRTPAFSTRTACRSIGSTPAATPGREVHAVLDGRADVLRGQSVRDRRRSGLFPAHDPDGQRQPRPRCASGEPISSAFTMPSR